MTVAVDAIHAGQLLGKPGIFQSVAGRQKHPARQAVSAERSPHHHSHWMTPLDAGLGTAGRVLVINGEAYAGGSYPMDYLAAGSAYLLPVETVPSTGHRREPALHIMPAVLGGAVRSDWLDLGRVEWVTTVAQDATVSLSTKVLNDIVALRDGWDGPESVAPSPAAKQSANAVVAQAAAYLADAEVEVDPTVGNPSLHWFSDDHQSVVSLTIQADGTVVVVASSMHATTYRNAFKAGEGDKLGRALVDAGVGRLNDGVR